MKTRKRDGVARAFTQGLKAGIKGSSVCPYENANKRGPWFGGWREGREMYWSGEAVLHHRTQTPRLH